LNSVAQVRGELKQKPTNQKSNYNKSQQAMKFSTTHTHTRTHTHIYKPAYSYTSTWLPVCS